MKTGYQIAALVTVSGLVLGLNGCAMFRMKVQDDDVRLELRNEAAGDKPVRGLTDFHVRLADQKFHGAFPERPVIVHDQHAQGPGQFDFALELPGFEEGIHINPLHPEMSARRFVGGEVAFQNPAPHGRIVNATYLSDLHGGKRPLHIFPLLQDNPSLLV